MKKTVKGGLALAILMAGSAQAALVKVDLTGTVNYGYQSGYDYNYNTGVNNSTYNDLTGTQAHFSFLFDTAKAPDQSYNYSDGYGYSYLQNIFSNAASSFTGNIGGTTFSGDNATAYTYNQNYYGSTYGGAEIYGSNYRSSDFSYEYNYFGLSSWGENPVDEQDFVTAFLSGANPISFYLYDYVYNWNSDGSAYTGNYLYAYGIFDNISVSPAAVPVPAAVWLFGSALMGLFGIRKRKGMMPMLTA